MRYRLKAIVRSDNSDAYADSANIAFVKSLFGRAQSDNCDLNLDQAYVAYNRSLVSEVSADSSDISLNTAVDRSLKSIVSSDSCDTTCKMVATRRIQVDVRSDRSDMQVPKAGAVRSVSTEIKTDSSDLEIVKLGRGFLGIPPTGSITVLWVDGEKPLDRLQLRKQTYGLNFRVVDFRFAGYEVTFEAISQVIPPAGPTRIVLSTNPKLGGGIDDITIQEGKKTPMGEAQELIAQAELRSEWLRELPGNTVFTYKLTFAVPMFSEHYILAFGQFLVVD